MCVCVPAHLCVGVCVRVTTGGGGGQKYHKNKKQMPHCYFSVTPSIAIKPYLVWQTHCLLYCSRGATGYRIQNSTEVTQHNALAGHAVNLSAQDTLPHYLLVYGSVHGNSTN